MTTTHNSLKTIPVGFSHVRDRVRKSAHSPSPHSPLNRHDLITTFFIVFKWDGKPYQASRRPETKVFPLPPISTPAQETPALQSRNCPEAPNDASGGKMAERSTFVESHTDARLDLGNPPLMDRDGHRAETHRLYLLRNNGKPVRTLAGRRRVAGGHKLRTAYAIHSTHNLLVICRNRPGHHDRG